MGEPIIDKPEQSPAMTYLSEARMLTSRWEPTGLLSGIQNTHVRAATAVLLENQRLIRECVSTDEREQHKAFWEASIKLVAKIFPQLIVNKIGSMQPMLGPASLVYFLKNGYRKRPATEEDLKDDLYSYMKVGDEIIESMLTVESEDVTAKTRKLKVFTDEDINWTSDLEMDQMAQKIVAELDQEHLHDIYNNAGTVATWDMTTVLDYTESEKRESLYVKLCEISGVIYRKTLRESVNFFVMGQKMYDKWGSVFENYKNQTCKIYVVDWNKTGVLMGYAGESYLDRGYHYCPYVPLTRTPKIISEDFIPRPGLLHRYGKKLRVQGAKHYARLEIKDNEPTT